jgi:hypothetical protein
MDLAKQLNAYRRRGLLVDANLLLLYFLGSYDRKQISSNKRLATFSVEDFDLIVRVLKLFSLLVTTPNILTEVSNLSNAIAASEKAAYFDRMATMLTLVKEEYVPSTKALANRWARFGLTDAAIAEIAKNQYLVLTDDLRLSYALQNDGIATINFNQIRDFYYQA